jgi:CHAD domain-containing protein
MAESLLNPQERQQIESLVGGDASPTVQRRARLLLLLDDGQPTQDAAKSVGITPGRARHWRGLFRSRGMEIFPSENKSMAPSEENTESLATLPASLPEPMTTPPTPEPFAVSVKSPGVEAEDVLSEAGRKVLRYHFGQMLLHEDGTLLGEDIEELHDMRVASRRMRAAFEVFADAYTAKTLKKLLRGLRATGRALGKVRDLDVFIEKAAQYAKTLPEDQCADMVPLLDSWGQEREAARAQMVEYLHGSKYAEFKQDYAWFLSTPFAGARQPDGDILTPRKVREIAPIFIYTRMATVRAFDDILESASLEQFHALRIEFKKLRYTVEFFREVLGEETKGVIAELKTIQDHLGDLNDAQVATGILRDYLVKWDTQQSALPVKERHNPAAILSYLLYNYNERQRLMQTFHEKWKGFNRPEFQHRLALAVSAL